MARLALALESIKIASPCKASWDEMQGDDQRRFCGQCKLHVYNLSAMSRLEAESFVAGLEGRGCVRLYRRFDGTVLTRDCPVGWAAMKRRLAWIGGIAATVLAAILGMFTWALAASNPNTQFQAEGQNPFQKLIDFVFPRVPQRGMVMGGCLPPPVAPGQQLQQPEAPIQN